MLDRGRAGSQQARTALGDGSHILKPFFRAANSALAFQSFAQCDRDRAGHRVAGQARKLASELTGFVVLDVECQGGPR